MNKRINKRKKEYMKIEIGDTHYVDSEISNTWNTPEWN